MTRSQTIPPTSQLGSYELIRPLAQGGMADLFLAQHRDAGELVALKILNPARAGAAEACAMFVDEARVVALLDHPNIARVREVAVADGQHYLAMEYVHGADLRELLAATQRAGSQLPYAAAVAIVAAAAAGLDHAHRRCGPDGKPLRLVHRDVSLSNIMAGHDGSVKVVDFGIAQTTITTVPTAPGIVRGKASYMSPEQCLGDPIDHRSDIFALGVVLYELATGVRCFHGKTDFDRMLAVVKTDYLPPGELIAGFPRDLADLIATALAAAPGRRFASAAAMIDALDRVATAHGWTGSAPAIRGVMRSLFGEVAAPRVSHADDGAVTDRRRMAHGTVPGTIGTLSTMSDDADGTAWPLDDADDRTHGRSPVRRPSRPRLGV